jgi:hypothetical protein
MPHARHDRLKGWLIRKARVFLRWMIIVSCVAAFAGLITDPIQHRLGLHARRLNHLLDAAERRMLDPDAPAYLVYDLYVARLLNFFSLLGSAHRLARATQGRGLFTLAPLRALRGRTSEPTWA